MECSLDELIRLRSTINEAVTDKAHKVSVNDFIVKASARALTDVPQANAAWFDDFVRTCALLLLLRLPPPAALCRAAPDMLVCRGQAGRDPLLAILPMRFCALVACSPLHPPPALRASVALAPRPSHLRSYKHADICVAVSTDKGLITPIITAADRKGLAQISAEAKVRAEAVRGAGLAEGGSMQRTAFMLPRLGRCTKKHQANWALVQHRAGHDGAQPI